MTWLLLLSFGNATLYRLRGDANDFVATWNFTAIVECADAVQQLLTSLWLADAALIDRIVVIVDQSGDILQATPEAFQSRVHGTTLRNSLALQLLGQQRYQAVLRARRSWKLNPEPDRFFALEDSPALLAWLAVLNKLICAADGAVSIVVYPQVLIAECAFGHELASLTPVIYCHVVDGSVSRHTLYRGGLARFTRVLAVLDDPHHERAEMQLVETISFLQHENLLAADEAVTIALLPDTTSLLRQRLSGDARDCVMLTETQWAVDPAEGLLSSDAVSGQLIGCYRQAISNAVNRRRLSGFDLNRSSRSEPGYWIRQFCTGARKAFVPVLHTGLRLTPVFAGLCISYCGYNGWALYHTRQEIQQQRHQLESINVDLARYPYSATELTAIVNYRHWLQRSPVYLLELLRWVGQQLNHQPEIRLEQLQWCWSKARADCLSDNAPVSESTLLTLADSNAQPESLLIRLRGELTTPFQSRRADYEVYAALRDALMQNSRMSLWSEDHVPHNQLLPQGYDAGSGRERAFTLVLHYQPVVIRGEA